MNTEIQTKRINYFHGFLAAEHDLNEAEKYHVEQRRLHSSMLHAPGVCAHWSGGLKVSSRNHGTAVEIAAGFAVDGLGREIRVSEPVVRSIRIAGMRLPCRVWVTASYEETFSDYVEYPDHPSFKGHSRIHESCRIEVTPVKPDNIRTIELAAIELDETVRNITDATDPDNPLPGEIDLRFVPLAGTAGVFLDPTVRFALLSIVSRIRRCFASPAIRGFQTAADLRGTAAAARIALACGNVDRAGAVMIASMLRDSMLDFRDEAEYSRSPVCNTREFDSFRWCLEESAVAWSGRDANPGAAANVLVNAMKNIEQLTGSLNAAAVPTTTDQTTIDGLRTRSAPFEECLEAGGRRYRLADSMDVIDPDSERSHRFAICNERDLYRSRQALSYPDGTVVEDVGVHFEGGMASFAISGVEPDREVLMLARTDVARGNFECEVTVNGRKISNLTVPDSDLKNRWRNACVVIPAQAVDEPVLRITITPVRQDRDVNIFSVWAYQQAPEGEEPRQNH